MSGFGLFEANVTSDDENKRQVREAANKLAAATYDVRERFGQFLFASRDLAEYNDRLALSKADILKTIEPHVFPRTGTVRRVLKPLETEFKSMRRQAVPVYTDTAGGVDGNYGAGIGSGGDTQVGEEVLKGSAGAGTEAGGQLGVSGKNDYGILSPSGGREPGWGGIATPDGKPAGGTAADLSNQGSFAPNSAPKAPGSSSSSAGGGAGSGSGGGSASSSSSSGGSGGGGGGSSWSANSNSDPIGPGEYKIQSGDTYSQLAQRAGWGDDYKGFAQATGYNADNPDMIYAGDTINVKAKPGSDSGSSASSSSTAGETSSAPLAAESGSTSGGTSPGVNPTGTTDMTSNSSGSMTDPGLSAPGQQLKGGSRRRRADFERNLDTDITFHPSDDELEPEGDFKGYLKSVDQGAEGKADRNFGGTFPGGTDHDGDPAKTDFAKAATRRFASWCQANRMRPTLAALDTYSPSDREYMVIAAAMQRVAGPGLSAPANAAKPKGPEWTAKGKPKQLNAKPDLGPQLSSNPGAAKGSSMPGSTTDVKMARRHYAKLCRNQGIEPTERGFRRWTTKIAGSHDAPFQEHFDKLNEGKPWFEEGSPYSHAIPELDTRGRDDGYSNEPPMMKRVKGPNPNGVGRHRAEARRRTAAPDYLQKADEALTNLLNQKAEEFQQSIQPLQQALQTVQQAEQEAAAANPMNVMPPAGTVNVLPQAPGQDPAAGGAPGGAAGGGMDPMAALMGGGDPSGGGDPMGGGGMDPSAMGGDPSQQMVARRGKARGGASPRTAQSVDDLWEKFTHETVGRGGEPDVETFKQKYRVGPRALKRIRQKALGG